MCMKWKTVLWAWPIFQYLLPTSTFPQPALFPHRRRGDDDPTILSLIIHTNPQPGMDHTTVATQRTPSRSRPRLLQTNRDGRGSRTALPGSMGTTMKKASPA